MHDLDLVELIDAVVSAVDASREVDVDRVRTALAPFGGVELFDAEFRLNARHSSEDVCGPCGWSVDSGELSEVA